MTNKPMLSVELRSVLSMILNALDRDAAEGKVVRGEMAQELRALLDKPAPLPVPEAWMRFDDDQKAIFTRSKRADQSEALYAHPTEHEETEAESRAAWIAVVLQKYPTAEVKVNGSTAFAYFNEIRIGSWLPRSWIVR